MSNCADAARPTPDERLREAAILAVGAMAVQPNRVARFPEVKVVGTLRVPSGTDLTRRFTRLRRGTQLNRGQIRHSGAPFLTDASHACVRWSHRPACHGGRSLQSFGGCHPAFTQSRRATSNEARFKSSAATVARPDAVVPTILSPAAFHRKCSLQTWWRGSNNRTRSPVKGSLAATRSDL